MLNFINEIIDSDVNPPTGFRFSPENNGHLHIGHAKSICLNFGLAEKYNSFCNLRFDDTNPSNEKEEYIESITKDIEWLGYTPKNIFFTSDYFDKIYDYAIILIKKGLAYVEDLSSEEIAILKGSPTNPGKDSPYRTRSISENIDLFKRMWIGEFKEESRTLRAKIDMKSPNMILRDPIIYRIIDKPHYRTLSKYKIYPMYDFAHPLSDYIEHISHSICTMEFLPHRDFYDWVLNNITSGAKPRQIEFARLNVDYTMMSKRHLNKMVESGLVEGLDDPRMPTLSGMRRRGYTPESIKDFCEKVGVTKRNSLVSHLLLEDCLRNDLNKRCDRIMGVIDPVKLTITNWDKGVEMVEIENNPENDSTRMVPFDGIIWIERDDFNLNPNRKYNRLKIGGEVRLKGAYVIKATEVIKNKDGEVIEILCTYDHLTKSGMEMDRRIKGTIHWVSIKHGINADIRNYDNLLTKECPDKDFINCFNDRSLSTIKNAVIEPSIINCTNSKAVQMIRKGYYIIDKDSTKEKIIINRVVPMKSSYI